MQRSRTLAILLIFAFLIKTPSEDIEDGLKEPIEDENSLDEQAKAD